MEQRIKSQIRSSAFFYEKRFKNAFEVRGVLAHSYCISMWNSYKTHYNKEGLGRKGVGTALHPNTRQALYLLGDRLQDFGKFSLGNRRVFVEVNFQLNESLPS